MSKVEATPPSNGAKRLDDRAVEACVIARFGTLTFPPPEGGIVTVVYPLVLNPSD